MAMDEISHVLRFFQPKPEFSSSDEIRPYGQVGSKRGLLQERNGFSSIKYYHDDCQRSNCENEISNGTENGDRPPIGRSTNTIRVSYVHDRIILLRFQIFCNSSLRMKQEEERSIFVHCIECYGPLSSAGTIRHIIQTVKELCSSLSSSGNNVREDTVKTPQKNCSLFAVFSKLLQSLQALPPVVSLSHSKVGVIKEKETNRLNKHDKIGVSNDVLDIGILMIRCAAASRRSATLCSPVPAAFCHNGEVIAHRILALTGRMDLRKITSSTTTTNGRLYSSSTPPSFLHSQTATPQEQDPLEAEFLLHFLSLPWTEGATLTTTKPRDYTTKKHPDDPTTGTRTLCLTLNIENAVGDASPHFTDRAERFGTLRVFHGTNPENVWSILTYGLRNLSLTSMSSNGAMMGKGVYLSTSYDVASFFAKTNTSKCVDPVWWRHPSFLRLLSTSGGCNLEGCVVTCFTVFEATILAPPKSNESTESDCCTRRDGTYLVVPNGKDICIKKLHLTFHIKKRSDNPFMPIWVLVLLAVVTAYFLMDQL